MSADTVAGGSRTVAVVRGKTGVHVSMDGNDPRPLPIKGGLSTKSLAEALEIFTDHTTVLLIGTRADGEPGWDEIDEETLHRATPQHKVIVLSEAQALALEPSDKQPAAWLILATAGTGASMRGSARWWVQDDDGTVKRVDVEYLGVNYGQIYTLSGENLASSPALVAGQVEALISTHQDIRRVCVWSQDGLVGNEDYSTGDNGKPIGSFWKTLRLSARFQEAEGDVKILPLAQHVLTVASASDKPMSTKTSKEV